jgi:hypothetical protein
MLRKAGARVADGPTQTNAYVLKVGAEQQVEAVQALRAEPAVVLVEQLDRAETR